MLARALGSAGYGVYVVCMTWAMLLSTLATFGLPNVAVRETARARAASDYKTIRSLAFFTYSIAAVGSCCAAVAVGIFVVVAHAVGNGEAWHGALLIAALTIPLASVAQVTGSFQSGYERVLSAQLPETVFRPLSLLALLTGSWLAGAWLLNVKEALVLYLFSSVASLLLGLALLTPSSAGRELPHLVGAPTSVDRAHGCEPASC